MEAENFLRMLESKFGLLTCTPVQKTLFAAQQLHGAAGAWWANHDRLNLNMGGTFAEFVNNAIVAEDGYRRVMAERKRSASAMGPSNGPPQKFRMVYPPPSGQRYRSAPVPAPVVRPPQPAQQRPPIWINSNKILQRQSAERIGKRKRKKKKPVGPACQRLRENTTGRGRAARPSRAAWSLAYSQRPLPRINGPTRTFGHPSVPCPNEIAPAFTPSLSLSLRHRLCFRRRRCSASPGRHRPPEPEPSFWKQRRDDPSSLHLFPLHRAVGIGRSARFFPGADSRPQTVPPRRFHPEVSHPLIPCSRSFPSCSRTRLSSGWANPTTFSPSSSLEAAADHRNPHLAGETAPPASLLQEKLGDFLLRAPVKLSV
ncbi:hypothetical protein PR202_ga10618 [Eleusine coracana subsp. coracana]|uniref:Retrotransposon gag domain-containing protein n=1 Tax=Eleusine coracana subsp. coracana TaxID=191504 RepID=A0AAV5C759_ELECO|nr:hypothetical protein PR202_ga10618 [Eleusine coracana subsp. coracana]